MPQKYSASVFQNWRKIHFLLHFHACSFNNIRHEWINFFMQCIYFLSFKLVRNWSNWPKAQFLCFSLLWITDNYNNLNYSQSFVNASCWKRCSWKWLSIKLPAANKCNCSQYGLMFITWTQWTRVDCGNKID